MLSSSGTTRDGSPRRSLDSERMESFRKALHPLAVRLPAFALVFGDQEGRLAGTPLTVVPAWAMDGSGRGSRRVS
jgi:hypothetical protein